MILQYKRKLKGLLKKLLPEKTISLLCKTKHHCKSMAFSFKTKGRKITIDTSKQCALFIVGPPRSGTTLLTLLLNSHENILQTNEAGIIILTDKILKQVKKNRSEAKHTAHSIIYTNEVHASFNKHAKDIVNELFQQCFHRHKKMNTKYFGDKHPHHDRCINFLSKLYPDAKFIYLTRFPLDVIHSMAKHSIRFDFKRATEIWKEITVNYETFLAKNKNSITLCYETLIENPQQEIADIMETLKLPADKAYKKEIEKIMARDAYGKNTSATKHQSNSGKYLTTRSREEIEYALEISKDYIKKHNYEALVPDQYKI
jgi:hypothetical protein